jgi:hypothetical protein
MLGAIIAIAVVVLLVVGFWWTRGAGPGAGSSRSPGRQELHSYSRHGSRVPLPGEDHEDREREIEQGGDPGDSPGPQ